MSIKIICFVTTSNTLKYCHHVIFLSHCFLYITVWEETLANYRKPLFSPDFFLRKFGFPRVSGAFRGEGRGLPRDSVGLQWDFSVIIWGSSKKIWWAVSDSTLWVLNENFEINDEILGVSNDYFDVSNENLEVTNEMVLGNFYKSGVSNDTPKMKILSQTRT